MIPKKIHTFWLSNNTPDNWVLKNIETWRRTNPDYEIIIHHADEFIDLLKYPYYNQMLNNHSWAYATDYLRSKILFEVGGWYFDADVTCHKSLNGLEEEFGYRDRWIGYEGIYPFKTVECASMGFSPQNEIMRVLVEHYESWKDGDKIKIMPQLLNELCERNNIDINPVLNHEYLSGVSGNFIPIPKNSPNSAQAYERNHISTYKSYTVHQFSHTGY